MTAAYGNKKDIKERVKRIVGTYHADDPSAAQDKDDKYAAVAAGGDN